jgi:ABC-type amino acid transport substrate-binding protein
MFFVWVIGVTKIVIHRDGFDDALDSLLAKRCDAWRDDGNAAEQVLTQLIVERANAVGPGVHG